MCITAKCTSKNTVKGLQIYYLHGICLKPTITETIRVHRLRWFGHVQRMEENRIPKKSNIYEFGSNKVERQTKKWMVR